MKDFLLIKYFEAYLKLFILYFQGNGLSLKWTVFGQSGRSRGGAFQTTDTGRSKGMKLDGLKKVTYKLGLGTLT